MQLYILTESQKFTEVLEWLDRHGQWYEVHLNRTRFTVEQGRLLTEFLLRYSDCIGSVADEEDLATGIVLNTGVTNSMYNTKAPLRSPR